MSHAGADFATKNEAGHVPTDYAKGLSPEIMRRLREVMAESEKKRRARELEERRRFPLEKRLAERIVGQTGAIAAVASGANHILIITHIVSSL